MIILFVLKKFHDSQFVLQMECLAKPDFLGFGTWQCSNEEAKSAVYCAIKAGYRHLDCAFEYLNEPGIGEGIKQAISEKLVKRNELWVTTKLWNTFHKPELVEYQCRKSLKNLQLDYLDAFIIHWPLSFVHRNDDDLYPRDDQQHIIYDQGYTLYDTWCEMEKLVQKGLVKHIGLSNFTILAMQDLLSKAKIKPFVHEIEVHPYLQNEKVIHYSQSHGMTILAYSPLGGNYSYGPLKGQKTPCLNEKAVIEIAKAHSKSSAQVILRWHLQKYAKNDLYCVLPKSSVEDRIVQNSKIFDFELTENEMEAINNLDRNLRLNDAGAVWWGVPTFD